MYHNQFPRMNSLFTDDIWEITVYDRDRKILLVRGIEQFFCFRPLAFPTRKKHLLKTVDHTPKHIAMDLHCLYCHCFSPRWRPNPRRVLPSPSWHPWHPLYCFGAKRFINKPRIVRSVLTFHDAISWNPDKFDAYSNTNSCSAERDWRAIIQIRTATAFVVSKRRGH